VVEAFYRSAGRGEDTSPFATGELRRSLAIQHTATRAFEFEASALDVRRLEVVDAVEDHAVVAVDVTLIYAYRYDAGEWTPFSRRIKGRVRLRRIDGRWLLEDVPGDGGSRLEAIGSTVDAERDGLLELEAEFSAQKQMDVVTFLLRNHGSLPIRLRRMDWVARVFLLFEMTTPLLVGRQEVVVEAGESWGERAGVALYRARRATVRVEGEDDVGQSHRASVRVGLAKRPGFAMQARRLFQPLLYCDLLGLSAFVPGLWPHLVGTLVGGAAFLLAGALRAPGAVWLVRVGARGPGVVAIVAATAVEVLVGTVLVFDDGIHWTTLVLWGTVASFGFEQLRRALAVPRTATR
jgi:hypothetical protein